jgi:hypothetical protein
LEAYLRYENTHRLCEKVKFTASHTGNVKDGMSYKRQR